MSEARRFVQRLAVFCIPLSLAAWLYARTFEPVLLYGSDIVYTTDELIRKSARGALTRPYEILFLGNSRLYRGVDPSVMSAPAYNFSFDGDSLTYYYFKLRFLDRHGARPKVVVIGLDYFQLAYQNYLRFFSYRRLFRDGEFDRLALRPSFARDLLRNQLSNQNNLKGLYVGGLVRIALALVQRRPLSRNVDPLEYLSDAGYYVRDKPPLAKPDDRVVRRYGHDRLVEEHLRKAVEFCSERGIEVVFLLAPLRDGERMGYTEEQTADFYRTLADWERRYHTHRLDYTRDARFSFEDYDDVTHLRLAAARRFSGILEKDLREQLVACPAATGVRLSHAP